jgi:hypothetical protein
MNRLGFLVARTLRYEPALRRLSDPQEALLAELAGRRVSLVGNARSLAGGTEGEEIDAADLVIRLNASPQPAARSHGTRTDWMAMSKWVAPEILDARAPRRFLWMPTKLRRLTWRVASSPGFVLRDTARNRRLRAELGAPATTGLLTIDLLASSDMAHATIWGFDFFASLSLSGRRRPEDVPHDFNAERAWVEALVARDRRFDLRVSPPADPGPAASAGAS